MLPISVCSSAFELWEVQIYLQSNGRARVTAAFSINCVPHSMEVQLDSCLHLPGTGWNQLGQQITVLFTQPSFQILKHHLLKNSVKDSRNSIFLHSPLLLTFSALCCRTSLFWDDMATPFIVIAAAPVWHLMAADYYEAAWRINVWLQVNLGTA